MAQPCTPPKRLQFHNSHVQPQSGTTPRLLIFLEQCLQQERAQRLLSSFRHVAHIICVYLVLIAHGLIFYSFLAASCCSMLVVKEFLSCLLRASSGPIRLKCIPATHLPLSQNVKCIGLKEKPFCNTSRKRLHSKPTVLKCKS